MSLSSNENNVILNTVLFPRIRKRRKKRRGKRNCRSATQKQEEIGDISQSRKKFTVQEKIRWRRGRVRDTCIRGRLSGKLDFQ